MEEILDWVSDRVLVTVGSVCQRWRRLAMEEWKERCIDDYDISEDKVDDYFSTTKLPRPEWDVNNREWSWLIAYWKKDVIMSEIFNDTELAQMRRNVVKAVRKGWELDFRALVVCVNGDLSLDIMIKKNGKNHRRTVSLFGISYTSDRTVKIGENGDFEYACKVEARELIRKNLIGKMSYFTLDDFDSTSNTPECRIWNDKEKCINILLIENGLAIPHEYNVIEGNNNPFSILYTNYKAAEKKSKKQLKGKYAPRDTRSDIKFQKNVYYWYPGTYVIEDIEVKNEIKFALWRPDNNSFGWMTVLPDAVLPDNTKKLVKELNQYLQHTVDVENNSIIRSLNGVNITKSLFHKGLLRSLGINRFHQESEDYANSNNIGIWKKLNIRKRREEKREKIKQKKISDKTKGMFPVYISYPHFDEENRIVFSYTLQDQATKENRNKLSERMGDLVQWVPESPFATEFIIPYVYEDNFVRIKKDEEGTYYVADEGAVLTQEEFDKYSNCIYSLPLELSFGNLPPLYQRATLANVIINPDKTEEAIHLLEFHYTTSKFSEIQYKDNSIQLNRLYFCRDIETDELSDISCELVKKGYASVALSRSFQPIPDIHKHLLEAEKNQEPENEPLHDSPLIEESESDGFGWDQSVSDGFDWNYKEQITYADPPDESDWTLFEYSDW
eukprot:TRINITY_DN1416_c0_g1_i1.p1 TRINITY_DN1416_c0_g1~~TRINITY_DN1416_c0_g1_i1.p1  ORF type:complete len:671 (-),score=132.50 TRINITY_DN1416_c0_g1_i1:122-2134(-)